MRHPHIKENMSTERILLSFDFGMKRIGVAVGQRITKTANPLTTLAAKSGEPDWGQVDALVKKWRPNAFIVGIPLNMDGTDQPITHAARHFAQSLITHYELPVHEMDERLTTKAAREELFEAGGYKALQSGEVDQFAAKILLENWFLRFP
jgi:putative Holliday junction resolvase